MGFADGGDLFEMMTAVDELESAPLLDAEGTENVVRCEAVVGEQALGLVAEDVESVEMVFGRGGEFVA